MTTTNEKLTDVFDFFPKLFNKWRNDSFEFSRYLRVAKIRPIRQLSSFVADSLPDVHDFVDEYVYKDKFTITKQIFEQEEDDPVIMELINKDMHIELIKEVSGVVLESISNPAIKLITKYSQYKTNSWGTTLKIELFIYTRR